MVKLADTLVRGASGRKALGVQIPLPAFYFAQELSFLGYVAITGAAKLSAFYFAKVFAPLAT